MTQQRKGIQFIQMSLNALKITLCWLCYDRYKLLIESNVKNGHSSFFDDIANLIMVLEHENIEYIIYSWKGPGNVVLFYEIFMFYYWLLIPIWKLSNNIQQRLHLTKIISSSIFLF